MFSIIIPLYNKAGYVAKAINSALNQTFAEFELIIVNDGSTDNGLEIVGAIHDGRIRIINQKNAGVSTARNNGVKSARFDYVAFLDADDWWDTMFLQEISVLIRKYPEAELYGSNYSIVKKGREINRINISDFEDGYINYFDSFLMFKNSPVCSSAVCIRKQCFLREKGFKSNLKMGEDLELWIRIACKYKIAYKNKTLAFYNQDAILKNQDSERVYPKENHFVFNMDEIDFYAQGDSALKKLMDSLKLNMLKPYHMTGMYKVELKKMLKLVDKSNFSLPHRLFYMFPPCVSKKMERLYQYINDRGTHKTSNGIFYQNKVI